MGTHKTNERETIEKVLRKTFSAAAFLAMALLVLVLFAACSDDTTGESNTSSGSSGGGSAKGSKTSGDFQEGTLRETIPEGTLSENTSAQTSEVVLRLEGTPKTSFRGLCNVEDNNEVLSGQVPKRFTFDLNGQQLSCRIQRQGPGKSTLKVILLEGDRTRSVQSTQSSNGTINLSYSGS